MSASAMADGDSFVKPGNSAKSSGIMGLMRKRKRRVLGSLSSNNDSSSVSTPLATPNIPASVDESKDFDAASVASLDLSPPPESKRSKRGSVATPGSSGLSRMSSLASVLSTPVARMGHALQRSFSGARLPHSGHGHHHPHPSPNDSLMSVRSSSRLNNSSSSQQQQRQHPGTPTGSGGRIFSRSVSHAVVANESNGRSVPDSPLYGTLRRGAPGRNSASHLTPYKPPQPTPNKVRPTRYWSEQFPASVANLTKQQVKFQEAMYEMCCGEEDLVEDMQLVLKTYGDSLLSLKILNETEVKMIFAPLRSLSPLHVELYRALRARRDPASGVSAGVGRILLQWTYRVGEPYVHYCANLIGTKAFLDAKREADKDFRDFLQRCLESPFSRKLDLWTYLDVPRSRLVKYPLLLKQVLKFSEDEQDCGHLATAIRHFEQILQTVDESMARAKCQHTLSRLDWLDEESQCDAVKAAKEEMLDGVLRNNRGTKLECHLMDTVLILGRPTTRGANNTPQVNASNPHGSRITASSKRLQVYRTPIPVEDLTVEDLDHSSRQGSGSSTSSGGIFGSSSGSDSSNNNGSSKQGSFKSAFSSGSSQPAKNSFRVSFRDKNSTSSSSSSSSNQQRQQHSHTLIASDEHSKKQWMTSIQKAVDSMAAKRKRAADGSGAANRAAMSPVGSASASKLPKGMMACRQALFTKHKRSPRIKASLSHAAIETLKRGGAARSSGGLGGIGGIGGIGALASIDGRMRLRTAGARNSGSAIAAAGVRQQPKQCRSLAALPRPSNRGASPEQVQATPVQQQQVHLVRHLPPRTASQHHQPKIMSSGSSSTIRKPKLASSSVLRDTTNRMVTGARTKSWGSLVHGSKSGVKKLDWSEEEEESRNEEGPRYLTRSKARQISKSMSDLLGVIV